jgi:prepilin-type N-terminal cleavage/methylation domain-containing protein
MQTKRRRAGFTLIELMVSVVIVGILAAVAIPSFVSYIYRSRTTEATTFLAEIRQRQESYRAEFGQYADVTGESGAYTPDTPSSGTPRAWTTTSGWTQLGARPDGLVRFGYLTIAGVPGEAPNAPGGGGDLGLSNPTDFWFVAQAIGDLDGDGETVLFETYSFSNQIYCDQPKYWE